MDSKFSYKIRYEYEIADNIFPNLTHGVWGGINPQNEIEINFYIERNKVSTIVEQFISKEGKFEQTDNLDETAPTITRHIHSSIVMNREIARDIVKWLQEKIDVLDSEENDEPFSFHNNIKLEQ